VTELTRVLTADPPWVFNDKLPGKSRGAAKNYSCLSAEDIARLPLPELADDAWLFLWRVHTHNEEALYVMRTWGFTYASELVWVKTTAEGKLHFGMGRTFRNCHEVCLVGRRGRPKPSSRSVRSVFLAPTGDHSEKPQEFYPLVEELTGGGPYVELFARRRREGWGTFGDQLPGWRS
jgi:N6-adenosine-specific RNA methylase IME4